MRTKKKPKLTMASLRCATVEDIKAWLVFHRQAVTHPNWMPLDSWCSDCDPQYRQEMTAEGRCIRDQ